VLSDLESQGYSAGAFVYPASAVGAPHRRERVFVVAYSESERRERMCPYGSRSQKNMFRKRKLTGFVAEAENFRENVENAGCPLRQGIVLRRKNAEQAEQ